MHEMTRVRGVDWLHNVAGRSGGKCAGDVSNATGYLPTAGLRAIY